MKNRAYKLSAAAVFCAVAAALIFTLTASPDATASAESGVPLSPVSSTSQVTYHYFDDPKSVFADSFGVLIADGNNVKTVSFDGTVSSAREINADKACRHGEYIITLENGSIHTYYGEDDQVYVGEFIDFDVEGNSLYAITETMLAVIPLGDTSFETDNVSLVPFTSIEYDALSAKYVSVCNGNIYVSVKSAVFGNKNDICAVDVRTGALDCVLMQSDEILSMSAMDYSEVLYVLTRDRLIGYSTASDGLIEKYSTYDALTTHIYAFDGFLYAVSSLNSLRKIPSDLSVFITVTASADDATGFFNMPSDAAVKNSVMYVADKINDRIAVYSDGITYIDDMFTLPTAVTCDSSGVLYVAHSYNTIDSISDDRTVTISVDGTVKQLSVDSDNNLYILSTSGLWVSRNRQTPQLISTVKYKAITHGVNQDALYALDGTSVVKLDCKSDNSITETRICDADASHFALAVDLQENVFLLSRTGITRYSPQSSNGDRYTLFDLTVDGKPYSMGFSSGQITLCTVQNDFVDYGDAIIVDTYKHRVFTVDGQALGITLIDESYEIPDLPNDNRPSFYSEGLIRTALTDITVFSLPIETPSVYTIAKGRKVIVPEYSIDDAREYSLILIDDLATGKLLQGYVYKNLLSDPLPYSAPPSDVCTVYTKATPVYKYPSPNAPTVRDYSAVDRATEFTMLDFVDSYRDDYNNLWYRVQLYDNAEGYILAVNLSLMNYQPVFIRPSYNAEIIAYNNSDTAQTFALVDGEYVLLDTTLPIGTQVEVVGAFDSSLQYTLIKYLDPNYGTLECYVQTGHIKYTGVNIVLVVAVIVIIITVILAALIIGRVFYVKKRRLISDGDTD